MTVPRRKNKKKRKKRKKKCFSGTGSLEGSFLNIVGLFTHIISNPQASKKRKF